MSHIPLCALATAAALAACATNPATGERQLVLMSESREISLGREAHPEIVAAMGLYADSALQEYVEQLGRELAASSERPHLPWTFRVLDDPVVNAFALPGGFIYVTRGILAHLDAEAQLAAVLGHEIGHVTARHSVEQMSRAQLAQVGLVAGIILAPQELQGLVDVAGAGLGLLFLKYGRDDERQADALGLRYVVRTGYDPRPMPAVFTMLGRVSAAQGGGRIPEWLSTHPNPANRSERIQEAIDSLRADFEGSVVERRAYLARLDGLVYGENPRDGFFRDNLFLHPDLAFRLAFPAGWSTSNQRHAVTAVSGDERALVQLALAKESSAPAAARSFLAQRGVRGSVPRTTSINGHRAVLTEFVATGENAELIGAAAFIEYGGATYRVLGYGTRAAWPRHQPAVQRTITSFDRLTDPEALAVRPLRLDVVTVPHAMTLAEFAERYPSVVGLEELALINQAAADTVLRAGTPVKRVVR